MSTKKESLNTGQKTLTEEIKKMKLQDVPVGFSGSVMDSIMKEKTTWWEKTLRWINSPLEFKLTPLRVGFAIAMVAVVLFFSPKGVLIQNQQANVVSVRFEFNAPAGEVKNVAVIGSFNEWSAESSTMRYDQKDRVWIYETNLKPGDHEYVFLVNGNTVIPDPKAVYYRKDGFGSVNSIVSVRSNTHEI
ncbi:hypothetical protein [Maridesulfovibrio sp.]|uniref:hypothetical protein n=1 Tax=Maridesulfovibrio sp. TaxID=2795000 RepID=UPI0029CA09E8|nr:hypothetical protein [Maridesulfovibrio sp.]